MKEIPEGIMKVAEHQDGFSYWRIACNCGCKDHDIDLQFETDTETSRFHSLLMSMQISFYDKRNGGFFEYWKAMWRRVKAATKILATGSYKMEGDAIFTREQVNSMIEVMQYGMQYADEKAAEHYAKIKQKKQVNTSS